MAKPNARVDVEPTHRAMKPQLQPAEEVSDQTREDIQEAASSKSVAPPASLDKIKAERDDLFDRFARTQAEFENARRRLAREQNEFKDLALAEALKSLLPILDGFDWVLQTRMTTWRNSAPESI